MKKWLRRCLILLVRLYGAVEARASAQQARQPASKKPHILLIRPEHLGDLILTTPVLRALKIHVPDADITMMVGPWSTEVVARHPDVDHILKFPFPNLAHVQQNALQPYMLLLRAAKQLRRYNYDIAINLRPHYWWGAALLYLARIPHRIGYATESGTGIPFLTEVLPARSQEHSTVSCLRLVSAGLKALGCIALNEPYTAERYPLYFIPKAEEQQWVTERLSREGIDTTAIVVVIHPGTRIEVKQWRPEAWARCATTLTHFSTDGTPIYIILTGTPEELPLLEKIARGISARHLIVVDATFGQLAALFQRAQLVLGVDSGPLHLAVSQGTATVRIFGPTDPYNFGPWGKQEQHISIVSTYRCLTCPTIPCRRLDFRPEEVASHPCVRLVPEEQVLAAITNLFLHTLTSSRSA